MVSGRWCVTTSWRASSPMQLIHRRPAISSSNAPTSTVARIISPPSSSRSAPEVSFRKLYRGPRRVWRGREHWLGSTGSGALARVEGWTESCPPFPMSGLAPAWQPRSPCFVDAVVWSFKGRGAPATAGEVSLICQVGRERMGVTGGSQVAYVLVEARPNTAAAPQTRMSLNFALVLERSGSMKGAKLAAVKESVKLVINRLEPADIVSVVVFDDNVRVVVPAQPATDKTALTALVDGIKDGGGTSMSLGMNVGLTELHKYASPAMVNRMILLTDGVTYGDADRCRRIADDAGAAGIGIYPLGIGADWSEDLLDNIGQRSSGMPAEFIRRPDDALSIFERQVQSAAAVAVTNVQLTVRLPVGVSPKKSAKVLPLIRDLAPDTLSDREAVVALGDLERDTPQSTLLELRSEAR